VIVHLDEKNSPLPGPLHPALFMNVVLMITIEKMKKDLDNRPPRHDISVR
jgi:hypothetical protein